MAEGGGEFDVKGGVESDKGKAYDNISKMRYQKPVYEVANSGVFQGNVFMDFNQKYKLEEGEHNQVD